MTEGVTAGISPFLVSRVAVKRSSHSPPCVRGEQVLSCKEPGGLFATCEFGNAPLFGAFQGSRADAKQMRGKRSSAVSTARDGAEQSEAGGL